MKFSTNGNIEKVGENGTEKIKLMRKIYLSFIIYSTTFSPTIRPRLIYNVNKFQTWTF